jgi:hypothetical protein
MERRGGTSIDTTRRAGRGLGGKRKLLGAAVGAVASVALALIVTSPAWASLSATGTQAPIGSGSHLLTVTNTGSEAITSFAVEVGEGFSGVATNIVPHPACEFGAPSSSSIQCTVTIAPGSMTRMCYTGPALGELDLTPGKSSGSGTWGLLDGAGGVSGFSLTISPSPAVASCPLPNFKAGSRTSTWSHTLCESAFNAWTKKNKHATSSQEKAEAHKLHKTHGCPLSVLK